MNRHDRPATDAPSGIKRTIVAAAGLAAAFTFTVILSPLQATVRSSHAPAASRQAANSAPPPQFDVATVKVNRSGGRGAPPRVIPATGQVTITNATFASVIQDAYGVQLPSNIINMPDWARTLRIDIVAKAASPAPVAILQRMLQPLLAEYFKLTVHREMREMDVFA